MKKAFILLITFYQAFFSVVIKSITSSPSSCRFDETCSTFTKRMINEQGVIRGIYLGIQRVAKCQPFYGKNLYGNI